MENIINQAKHLWTDHKKLVIGVAIIIVIGLVISAEIFNTSIEELVNLVSPQKNEKAGIIKDLAAAAVLILAITALITGLIIFLPKIISFI